MKSSFQLKNRHIFWLLLFVMAHLLAVDVLTELQIYPFKYRIMTGIYSAFEYGASFKVCSVFQDPYWPQPAYQILPEQLYRGYTGEYRYTFLSRYLEVSKQASLSDIPRSPVAIRFVGAVSGHLEAASVHSNGPYYDVHLVQLLNAAEYRESAIQGVRAGVIAVILSAGVLVFILSARLADRSLRGKARLKALLPALGLALLACLDVLWIVRLVNPGCG